MFLRLLFILTFLSATATGQVRIIPNKGQWSKNFLYKADVVSGAVFFERQGLKYIFHDAKKLREIGHHHTTDSIVNFHALYVDFAGANSNPKTTEKNPSTEFYNYYLGKDESHWAAGVHAYSNIKYQGIYEGINLITDAEDEALKFTWEVAPKISPKKIILRIKGADKMLIAENGDLKITTSLGEVIEQTPVAWQYIKGKKKMVVCKYWQDSNEVGFVFPNGYDETQTLTIDPTVIFATFSGSKADNFGFTATYDSVGAGYSGGTVFNYPGDSFAFPTTAGAFQRKFGGGVVFNNSIGDYDRDCGILKYNATGTKLLWATYLGGKGNEEPHSMVVDGKNNLLVYGTTTSKNFAFTKTAYDTTYSDSTDIFITKFSGDSGKLMASTYLGGSHPDGLNGTINTGTKNKSPLSANYADIYRGEVISDAQSNVFVASSTASTDFPITANAYQKTYGGGGNDGCIFKMNSTLSKLVWSTYLGGKKYDAAFSLQTDSNGNIFTCGGTQSPYFFKDTLTYQKTIANDSADAFVCSISPDGSVVENATYLGTKYYDQSYFVQLDKKQNVYLYGQTGSPAFPVKNVKYYNPKAGQFITKFNHSLDTIIFSSVFGSPRAQVDISPSAFLVDDCGKIYVSGWGGEDNPPAWGGRGGNTTKMPITSDAFQSNTDGSDFYIAVFARDMDTLLFSSYFGGTKSSAEHVDGGTSRFDKRGVIYQSVCGGCGGFSDFPTTAGAWSRTNKGKRPQNTSVGGCNNLLFKVNLDIPDLIARFTMPPHICATYTVNFTNQSVRAKGHKWFFGDGDTSTAINPTHVYKTKGIYTVTLVVTNLLSCSVTDTFKQNILVYLKAKADFKYKMDTCSHIVTFNSSSALATKYFWHFGNGDTSSIQNPIYKYLDSGKYNVTLYADANTTCADTIVKLIKIKRDNFDFKIDTCNNTVSITKISVSDSDFVWYFDSFQTFNVYPSYQFATTGKHTIKLIPRWQKPCDSIIKIINIPKRTKPKPIYSVDTCSGQFIVSNINFPDSNVAWIIDAKDTVKTVLLKKILPIGKHKFTLVTYYQSGCDDTTSFFVNIPPIIKPDFTYTNDTCNRTYKFKADFHLNTTYHWNLGDGNADSGQIAKPHSYAVDSTYAITLTTNKGKVCEQSITKIIKTPTPPKAHFTFVIDSCTGIVQFINTSSRTIKSSNWNFGDGAIATSKNPNHKYAKEGVFKVLLLTSKGTGCEDTASALITTNGLVDELKYYNVITPDGNGENEFFRVWGIKEKCGDYTLEIFNRWGQHVYEKTGRNLEWHGRTQVGIPVPAGTYYWIISGKHIEQIEGSVTVVR